MSSIEDQGGAVLDDHVTNSSFFETRVALVDRRVNTRFQFHSRWSVERAHHLVNWIVLVCAYATGRSVPRVFPSTRLGSVQSRDGSVTSRSTLLLMTTQDSDPSFDNKSVLISTPYRLNCWVTNTIRAGPILHGSRIFPSGNPQSRHEDACIRDTYLWRLVLPAQLLIWPSQRIVLWQQSVRICHLETHGSTIRLPEDS